MQDDTDQTANTTDTGQAAADTAVPDLNLGTNPSAQTDTGQTTADIPAAPVETPAEDTDAQTNDSTAPGADVNIVPPATSDDLESIKSSALQELAPIVNELEQEPEEKYRTLMMLIQSSDDQKLIKDAFEAAHNIEDSKAKADALLTIINEINYFTGKGEKTEA
ncbi:MAG TPA: hypothetical protein VFW77_00430 [Candidatus Saccharimonadales bacterium]|nr:hypothetical protein [Candidatus Saccharimonadales bacterium]